MSNFIKMCYPEPYIIDKNGVFSEASESFLELCGYSLAELRGKPFTYVWKELLRINHSASSIHSKQEALLFTKSFEAKSVMIQKQPLDSSNETRYLVSQRPNSRLHEDFPYINYLYINGRSGVAMYSVPDLILIKANQQYLSSLDAPFHDKYHSIGKAKETIITGYKGSKLEKMFQHVMETGVVVDMQEEPYYGLHRGITYWNNTIVPILEDGRIRFLIQVSQEVTEAVQNRKLLEEQNTIIKEQKKQLEAVIQNIPSGVYVTHIDGRLQLLNETAKSIFYNAENLKTLSDSYENSKYYQADESPLTVENGPSYRALRGEIVRNERLIMKRPDKDLVLEINSTPIYDDKGHITMSVTCSHDITEIIHKKQEIMSQKEQLEAIINHISDILYVFDPDGNYILRNKAALSACEAGNNKKINDFYKPSTYYDTEGNELPLSKIPHNRILQGEAVDEQIVKVVTPTETRYLSTSGTPIFDKKGNIVLGILSVRDITKTKSQSEIIKEQKEFLEAVIENIDDAIFIFDKNNNHYMQNKAAREYFPCTKLRLYGDGHIGAKYFDLDGNEIPREEMTIAKVCRGQTVKNHKMKMVQGDAVRYISVSGRPVYDENNNLLLSILHSRDITEQLSRENVIQKQQQILLQQETEKREALEASIKLKDEFLYLITHEFRTPMAVVNSALQTIDLLYQNEVTANIGKYLNTIKQNTNRQLRLVNNLLDITKMSSGNIKLNQSVFDIVYVTKAIAQSVDVYAAQKGVRVLFETNISQIRIFLDDEKYERILLNLLANALKFTPRGNSIYVSLSTRKQGTKSSICIAVRDEGIGIPKSKHKLIFERFGQANTSLSRQAEGTGLGLHLVKLLVDAMEGEILLESEVGQGSTFTVLLPILKPTDLDEVAASIEDKNRFLSDDSRIVHAASVEFSDIYFD